MVSQLFLFVMFTRKPLRNDPSLFSFLAEAHVVFESGVTNNNPNNPYIHRATCNRGFMAPITLYLYG